MMDDLGTLCLNIVALPPPSGISLSSNDGKNKAAKANKKAKGKWRRPQKQQRPAETTTTATTTATKRPVSSPSDGTNQHQNGLKEEREKQQHDDDETAATATQQPQEETKKGALIITATKKKKEKKNEKVVAATMTTTRSATEVCGGDGSGGGTSRPLPSKRPRVVESGGADAEHDHNNNNNNDNNKATTTTTTTATTAVAVHSNNGSQKKKNRPHPHDEPGPQQQQQNNNKTTTSGGNGGGGSTMSNNNKGKKRQRLDDGSSSTTTANRHGHQEEEDKSSNNTTTTTAERAAYLARYHAHPKELDRRHHTTSFRHVPKPAPSNHLFHVDGVAPDVSNHQNHQPNGDNGDDGNNKTTATGTTTTTTTTITWPSLGISDFLHQRLVRLGYPIPTTIQAKSCRVLDMKKKAQQQQRVMIHSETGSGKTLAYLLPILIHAMPRGPKGDASVNNNTTTRTTTTTTTAAAAAAATTIVGTRLSLHMHCLILVPTRELAYQIYATASALTAGTPLVAGVAVGAEKRATEKAKLRKGVPILIATLGRLVDHIQSTTNCDLSKVQTIVLDEVDRLLLDRPDVIDTIVAGAVNLQNLIVVSATCDHPTVAQFCRDHNGVIASSGLASASSSGGAGGDGDATTNDTDVWQHLRGQETTIAVPHQLQMLQLTVHAKYRFPALLALLGGGSNTTTTTDTVVFCATCAAVDYYHALMQSQPGSANNLALLKDIDSMKLHGNMELADRTACLKKFRSSSTAATTTPSSSRRKVLWTTDVAARGLNLSGDASQQSIRIVQYDPPTELSDYLHRAGRTARAGGAGTCLIFTLPTESQPFADLLRETTHNANILLPISLNETLESAAPCFPNLQPNGGRVADAVCLEISRHLEQKVYQSDDLLEMARTAFLAHIRAYAVKEKALKSVFVARGLHLGHVARSFLLKEPPTSFSSGAKRLQNKKGSKHNNNKKSKGSSLKKQQNVVKAPPPGVNIGQRKKSQLLFSNAAKLEGTMDGL